MHTITLSDARAGALLTALVELHGQVADNLVFASRAGDGLGAELAELRLEILDGLLEEIGGKFPDNNGWRVPSIETAPSIVIVRETRQ
jgi:hypothetical protein